MLWVLQKGNLSLFSTNTDGCCFEWGLVLVKHDKVRDDTPLVTKVWRSRNASAVAFFSQDNLLFMYQLPIKGRSCRGRLSGLFVLRCVHVEVEKWENEQNFHAKFHKMASQYDSSMIYFLSISNRTHVLLYIQYDLESSMIPPGHEVSHLEYKKSTLYWASVKVDECSSRHRNKAGVYI